MDIGYRIILFSALLYTVSSQDCSNSRPCVEFRTGDELIQPVQATSFGRSVILELDVDIYEVAVDWLVLQRRLYNGRLTGPTIWAKPGDIVRITLNNRLSPRQLNGVTNMLRWPNSTNLHFHGLNLSPEVDDETIKLDGGERRSYNFVIERDQPAGTNWYHPSLFGSSLYQTSSGMAGLFIIQDDFEDESSTLALVSCPNNCQHDYQLIFQPTLQYSGAGQSNFGTIERAINGDLFSSFREGSGMSFDVSLEEWLADPNNNVNYFTTNGQLQPDITIERGQLKRFRLVNAGGTDVLEINIPASNGVYCEVREIAVDGTYLNRPRVVTSQTLILPGSRVDWLIKCNQVGRYQIFSDPLPINNPTLGNKDRWRGNLATINVVSSAFPNTNDFPNLLPKRPDSVGDLTYLNDDTLTGRFVLEANAAKRMHRSWFSGPDDVLIRYSSPVDGVEEWNLLNTDPTKMHPIHFPTNRVQLISYNKYNGPISVLENMHEQFVNQNGTLCELQYEGFNGNLAMESYDLSLRQLDLLDQEKRYANNIGALGMSQIGEWRNVVSMPPLSNITIRFRTHKHSGEIYIGSSRLISRDEGMLMSVYIANRGETVDVQETNAGAYMGQCYRGDWYPPTPPPSLPPVSPFLSRLQAIFVNRPWYKAYLQSFVNSVFN